MLARCVCVLLAIGCSSGYASRPSFSHFDGRLGGVPPLVEEMLYNANLEIARRNLSVVGLPSYAFGSDHWLNFRVLDATVGNLSTLVLRGDDQVFKQTDVEGGSVISFRLTFGLDRLILAVDYSFKAVLLHGSGGISLSVDGEKVEVAGKITSMSDGSCSAKVESAVLADLGTATVSGTSGVSSFLFKHAVQIGYNHVLPRLRSRINSLFHGVIMFAGSPAFEKMACSPFTVLTQNTY